MRIASLKCTTTLVWETSKQKMLRFHKLKTSKAANVQVVGDGL